MGGDQSFPALPVLRGRGGLRWNGYPGLKGERGDVCLSRLISKVGF